MKAIIRVSPLPERDEAWAVFFPAWHKAMEAAIVGAVAPWCEQVGCFSHPTHVYPTGSSIYTPSSSG